MQPHLATLCITDRLRGIGRAWLDAKRGCCKPYARSRVGYSSLRYLSAMPVISAEFFAPQAEPHRRCDVARGQRGLHRRAVVRGQGHLNLVSPIVPRGTRCAAGDGRVALRSTELAGRRGFAAAGEALRYSTRLKNDHGSFIIQKAYLVQARSRLGAMRTLPAQWRTSASAFRDRG
jgi:hypothetical protein